VDRIDEEKDLKPNGAKRPPAERVADHDRTLAAMRQGVLEAPRRHKQAGVPIVAWRNGRIEKIPADELRLD